MRKLNLYISPLYIISAFCMIYFGAFDTFCYYFVALWIHEISHYLVAKKLGYMLNNLDFLPYGARLRGNTNYKKSSHEIIVSVAGPISNIIVALFIIAMWWVFPITYAYTNIFVEANLYIGIFNLIPIFPLDGGQVLLASIPKSKKKKIYNVMRVMGIVVGVVYMALFIVSAFDSINFSLFFVSLFIFITSMESYNVDIMDGVKNMNFKLNDVAESKSYVVSSDTNLLGLTKYFSANYFITFLFVDKNLDPVIELNQRDILRYIEQGKYFVK